MDGPIAAELETRYSEVFRFVRRHAVSAGEAEEITQSVFAQAAARLDSAKSGSPPPLAWLYTVAQRRLIDAARRRNRIATLPLREASEEAIEPEYGAEVAVALRKALASLSSAQREVVILRLVEGRRFAEIADRVGATEAACKMRFLRGLASVREVFEKEGIEP